MRKNKITKEKLMSFVALLSFTAYMPVSCMPAFAEISADTMPSLNSAVNGEVYKDGDTLHVNNTTYAAGSVAQFDWNTFNVGKDVKVNFGFSANYQTALNRVLASGGMSEIYGKLTDSSLTSCASCANTGKVILINPSGILFGAGSKIDLNSFTASTFDVNGAKNIGTLSEGQLDAYQKSGLKANSTAGDGGLFDIAGYNKTVQFVGNNNMVSEDGNGIIKVDAKGTRLASIVVDDADVYGDKHLGLVGNKIEVKNGSKLGSHYDSTPNAATRYDKNGKSTWISSENRTEYFEMTSGVKLVTGDGVNFYYMNNGGVQNKYNDSRSALANVRTADKMIAGQNYGVSVKDSTITGGAIDIHNAVDSATKSNVEIKNSTISTKRMLGLDSYYDKDKDGVYETFYNAREEGTYGGLWITGNGKADIQNSNIQVYNDTKIVQTEEGGTAHNITAADIDGGGHIVISNDKGVDINTTQIRTADSTAQTADNIHTGFIKIEAKEGNVNLTSTSNNPDIEIESAGHMLISAGGDVTIDGYSSVQAIGKQGISDYRYRTMQVSANNVNIEDATLNAAIIDVDARNAINSTNGKIVSNFETNLLAKTTKLDSSLLSYGDLNFYEEDGTKVNNVTIKNDTTLNDKGHDGLVVTTNGNLTIDNDKLQKKGYYDTYATNQKSIELNSTTGNVTVKNSDYILTQNGGIKANADNGNVEVKDSWMYATNGNNELIANGSVSVNNSTVWAKDGNINLTSNTDKVTVTNGSNVSAEGGNTTITQAKDMNIDTDFNKSTVGATGKLTLKTDGNISGTKMSAGGGYIMDYKNLTSLNNLDSDKNIKFIFNNAEMNSGKNINITDMNSATNVDFVANNNIDLTSTKGMDLTNVSVSAGNNNNTNITAQGRLQTDKLDILSGKKTTLTGSSVVTNGNSTINANSNKLAVNADTNVNISVTGVDNARKGIEVNANVNTSNGSAPLAGKDVTIRAKDGTLAISKIKSDHLNLTTDRIIKADTTISGSTDNVSDLIAKGVSLDSKGYVEIATDGGFNLDPTTTYSSSNSNMYTGGNYGTTVTVGDKEKVGNQYSEETKVKLSETENSERLSSVTTTGDETGRTNVSKTLISQTSSESVRTPVTNPDGTTGYDETVTVTSKYTVVDDVTYATETTEVFKDTKTTVNEVTTKTYQDYKQTTTTNDTQHIATLNDAEQNGFVLVYGKTTKNVANGTDLIKTSVKEVSNTEVINPSREVVTPGSKVVQETYVTTESKSYTTHCSDQEPTGGNEGSALNIEEGQRISSLAKIPRHIEGIGDSKAIKSNIADSASTVLAAAARLQLDEENLNEDIDDSSYNYDDEYLN